MSCARRGWSPRTARSRGACTVGVEQAGQQVTPLPLGGAQVLARDVLVPQHADGAQDGLDRAVLGPAGLARRGWCADDRSRGTRPLRRRGLRLAGDRAGPAAADPPAGLHLRSLGGELLAAHHTSARRGTRPLRGQDPVAERHGRRRNYPQPSASICSAISGSAVVSWAARLVPSPSQAPSVYGGNGRSRSGRSAPAPPPRSG